MIESAFLIPAFPLLGFAILAFFGKKIGDPKAGWIGTAAVGMSFVFTLVAWLGDLTHIEQLRRQTVHMFDWINAGGLHVNAALLVDPLSLTMALFVTGVSTLIHMYSIGYMKSDPRFHQFFAYLNLFVFSMIILVMADNFLMLFLGWEGVGTCSYLLVGFWFERQSAATAAKKAFIVNRIGDVGLLLGMFVIFKSLGTLTFFANGEGVLDRASELAGPTLTAIALLLFVGAVGKSAQLPLHVWLPDAMEGPTPVSALIHAATMVTAGVYLMARIAPILELSHTAALTVAIVGGVSALFAATIACAQDDIKRVLAYSTMSQLGYMFLSIGAGAYTFGLFHMVTHAFFKALLFLSAGAVIHALYDEQDLKKMGNLRKYLPVTFGAFLVGWLAISGFPPFAGFWSKDEILIAAWERNVWLWVLGLVTVFLTAYYMSRLFFLAFYGKARWNTAAASQAKHEEPVAERSNLSHEHGKPHEAPWVMTVPMIVLAVLSVLGGLLDVTFAPFRKVLDNFLTPVLAQYTAHEEVATNTKLWLDGAGVLLAILGIATAWLITRSSPLWPRSLEPKVLARAWFIDPIYSFVFEKPGLLLARWSAFVIDNRIVDGLVNGSARIIGMTGVGLRRLQTGYVRSYALSVAAGTALLLVWVFLRSAQ